MAERIRSLAPLASETEVMVAGDPEKLAFTRRTAEGVPVDEIKFGEFLALSPEFHKAVMP